MDVTLLMVIHVSQEFYGLLSIVYILFGYYDIRDILSLVLSFLKKRSLVMDMYNIHGINKILSC